MPSWVGVVPALGTALYLGLLASAGRPGTVLAAALAGGLLAPAMAGGVAAAGWKAGGWPWFAHPQPTVPSGTVAAVEELAKLAVVVAVCRWLRRDMETWLDGGVFGLAVGVGYALGGHLVALVHLAGPPPALGAELQRLGYGMAQALFPFVYGMALRPGVRAGGIRWWVAGAAWATGVAGSLALGGLGRASQTPGLWQALATSGLLLWQWAPVGLLVSVYLWNRRRERELLVRFLREEVGTGVVSEDEFLALLVDARAVPRPRRVVLSRLAQAKWRVSRGLAPVGEVEAWRDRVRRTRRAS